MLRKILFGIVAFCVAWLQVEEGRALICIDSWSEAYKCMNGCGCAGGGNTQQQYQQPQYQPPTPAQQATGVNQQGNAAFSAGNFELAIRLYDQALRLNPSDGVIAGNLRRARAVARARALNQQGVAASAAGDWQLALKLQTEAARLEPDNSVIRNNVKIVEQQISRARATLLNNKGVEADKVGDATKAAQLYEEAARLDPGDPVIADNFKKARAKVLVEDSREFSIKDPAKSLAMYEQAARLDPNNQQIAEGLNYYREFVEKRRADEVDRKRQEIVRAQATKINGETLQGSIKDFTKSLDTGSPATSGSKLAKVEVASGGSLGFMDANQKTSTGSGLLGGKVANPTAEDTAGRSTNANTKSKTVVDQAAAAATKLNANAGCVYDGQAGCEAASVNVNSKAQTAAAQSSVAEAVVETIRKNKQAMANPAIAKNLDFYLQAEKIVAEKQAKLEEVQKKLKSGDGDPVTLKAQAGTYENEINISNANKNAAVRQMKEEAIKDKNLALEFPPEIAVPNSAVDPAKTVNSIHGSGVPSPLTPQ